MAGRQIRWQSVGRIGAVVLAVIAAIASLPALLGSDSPPPVPDDVGLVPPAAPARELPPEPPIAGMRPSPPELRAATKKRRGDRKPARARRRERNNRDQGRSERGDSETSAGEVAVPVYIPAPAYSPSRSREFQIEP